MKWIWPGWKREPSHSERKSLPEPETQRSLALKKLTSRLRGDRLYDVLDLGSSVRENVEFCSSFCRRLYIEDFYRTVTSFDFLSPEDGVPLDTVYQYLLPFKPGTRFDVILAWDLLNYLQELECKELMNHLARFCKRNSLMLAFISTRKSIPESPARYSILDDETITCQTRSNILRPCPQYQEPQLAKLMPGYQVVNSYLLRNGLKEYLFSFSQAARSQEPGHLLRSSRT